MARRYEGHLFVLCVFEPAEASRGVKQEALAETARHQFGAAVEALSNAGTAAGVPIVATIAIGSPAQQILKHADELHADHVVLGQRGKNSHERSIVGSVSLRVATHSTATVTVVR